MESSEGESDDSDGSIIGARRLGDRLFADKKLNDEKHLRSLLQEVKSKSLRQQVIDKELPELRTLLEDLEISLQQLLTVLQPLKADGKLKQVNKQLAAFVDLKYNLLLSYATYLTFYLLLRVEGASNDIVRDHPVLFKITTLKKTLDGLHGLDSKLESVLKRKLQGKNLTLLGKRPEPENAEDGKDEASEQSEAASLSEAEGSYDEEGGDEDMEDDMDDNVVDTDALLTRTE